MAMKRVLIIGPCGSGKSTLLRKLGPLLGLPTHHLDRMNWKPGWIESDRDELRTRIADVVAQERWLIDGNYGGSLDLRLPRADTIIYLDFPIALCLWRVFRRMMSASRSERPDMTEGCTERLDLAFLFYVATWAMGPRKRTETKLAGFRGSLVRLESPAATKRWLAGIRVSN